MKFWGTAEVVKRNKRLFIQVLETEQELYSPPDHVRPHIRNREKLWELARTFTAKQERCIDAIIAFETDTGHQQEPK